MFRLKIGMLLTFLLAFVITILWIFDRYNETLLFIKKEIATIYEVEKKEQIFNHYQKILNNNISTISYNYTNNDSNIKYSNHQNIEENLFNFINSKIKNQSNLTNEITESKNKSIRYKTIVIKESTNKELPKEAIEVMTNLPIISSEFYINLEKTILSKIKERYKSIHVEFTNNKNEKYEVIKLSNHKYKYLNIISPFFSILKILKIELILSFFLLILTASVLYLSYQMILKKNTLNLQQREFISNITHELKTPISTTLIAKDAILDNLNSQNTNTDKENLDIIQFEMNRLNNLIDTVVFSSQIDYSSFKLRLTLISLNIILFKVKTSLNKKMENYKKNITFKLDHNTEYIMADETHFFGAIYNLLDNAIKYSNRQINLSTKESNLFIEIYIEDDGKGVEKRYYFKLFEKYYRHITDKINTINGTGLGLYYTKNVIENQNFNIDVTKSSLGGLCFKIQIPKN